jgi:glycerol-3-phosphate dehydrogenase (NAD(P)+)
MKDDKTPRIGVIGAGAWGTALSNLLAEKEYAVDLWVREQEVYDQIKNKQMNETFLPGTALAPSLNPVRTYQEALADKDIALIVVPSHVFRRVLSDMRPHLPKGISLITATKGIENNSLKIMSQVAEDVLPKEYAEHFSCLAGPSFAKEVARRLPAAVTIACRDLNHAEQLQKIFSADYFRVYTSDDLVGIQLCGALKNVIAIAAGASDGLGFGLNARAALITRGLAEITRLGVAMGANPMTFAGLSGMGDLILTCTGDLSRNRTVGLKIAQGMSLKEITIGVDTVAEGIKTALSAYELAKNMDIDMPITTQVYEVLYKGKDPSQAVKEHMARALKSELEPHFSDYLV